VHTVAMDILSLDLQETQDVLPMFKDQGYVTFVLLVGLVV